MMAWLQDHLGWVIVAVTAAIVAFSIHGAVSHEAAATKFRHACYEGGGIAVHHSGQWQCLRAGT